MPSLRTLFTGLALTALPHLSTATPVPADAAADCVTKPISVRATPTIPASGDPTELPSNSLTLSYVAIGRGIQNYTCSAVGAAPAAIGAVATLYDATALAYADENILNTIPAIAVYMPASSTGYTLPAPIGKITPLGHHFFGSDGTPTFDLTAVNKILYAKKVADIKAPATANKGPAGTGAVDWLQLTNKTGSVDLQMVYRVETAGGAAPVNCTSTALISVQYAAEYWFFD